MKTKKEMLDDVIEILDMGLEDATDADLFNPSEIAFLGQIIENLKNQVQGFKSIVGAEFVSELEDDEEDEYEIGEVRWDLVMGVEIISSELTGGVERVHFIRFDSTSSFISIDQLTETDAAHARDLASVDPDEDGA